MKKEKEMNILKSIILFTTYFIYYPIISKILSVMGVNNQTILSLVSDLVYLIGIVYIYKDYLKESFKRFIDDSPITKKIILIFKWVLLLFVLQIIVGIIAEMILGEIPVDDNSQSLLSLSFLYTLFKVFIFSVIAEELLFRTTIRKVITNNILFIIISALLYSFMNVAYADWSNLLYLADFMVYFFLYSTLNSVYVKYDNIIINMFIKFIHAFIPLIILMLGVV